MTLNNANIRNQVALYFGTDPAAKQSTINTYGEIANWNVTGVTDMRYAFFQVNVDNQVIDLSAWDVSNVTTFQNMFQQAQNLTNLTGLSDWDVGTANSFHAMFAETSSFNEDISGWNMSNAQDISYMFFYATIFNQYLYSWDLTSANNVGSIFNGATKMLEEYPGISANPALSGAELRAFWKTTWFPPPPAPTITVIGDNPMTIVQDATTSYTDLGASAVDHEGTNLNAQVQVSDDVDLTTVGTYTVTYSVTDSNGQTSTANRTVIVNPPPTCFPAGTPIQTDQGVTAIEQLVPGEHTLRGKSIIALTQTRPHQKHIVCFEKDSIGKNVPSQQTFCSKEHKVLYQGEMTKARDLADMCKNVKKVAYNGETLYNVLLEKHGKMLVNNMICETLHPENIAAKNAKMENKSEKRILTR